MAAHFVEAGRAVTTLAAIDVDVVSRLSHARVRAQLQRGRGRAAVGRAAAGGEADQVPPTATGRWPTPGRSRGWSHEDQAPWP